MRLAALAERIGARIVTPNASCEAEVCGVVAGDMVSDLLNRADTSTLIVTNLFGPQLVRLAQLMDVPGVCMLNGVEPGPDVLAAAGSEGTVIMVAPEPMYQVCGRLYAAFAEKSGGQR